MAELSNPVDDLLTGAKIRYRLNTSNNLREGHIIACSEGYAWVSDTETQQVACIHKSGIIFDNIPNTGIRMPRADEVKYVGPVQTGKLQSDQLESQLHDRTEAQKTALLENGHAFQQREQTLVEEEPTMDSPRSYRLTQLGANASSGVAYGSSTDLRRQVGRRSERSPRQRSMRANGRYLKKEEREFEKEQRNPTPIHKTPERRTPPATQQYSSGFYFSDDAGKLFYQQDSGLTFYVDANNMFHPVNHRKPSRRETRVSRAQYDMVAGADPRLVPELFEGWTDEKGVWYPRSSAPRDRHHPGPRKRLFEDKARDNPFLWQNKSMEERVQAQLEHYFSPGNLETDSYMKSLMDSRGYVEAKTICSFRRMQHHHVYVGLVLQAAQQSKSLKVKGTKIRARNAWWLHIKHHVPEEERVDSQGDDEKVVGIKVDDETKEDPQIDEDLEDVKGEPVESLDSKNTIDERKVGKTARSLG